MSVSAVWCLSLPDLIIGVVIGAALGVALGVALGISVSHIQFGSSELTLLSRRVPLDLSSVMTITMSDVLPKAPHMVPFETPGIVTGLQRPAELNTFSRAQIVLQKVKPSVMFVHV